MCAQTKSLVGLFEAAIRDNGDHPALSDYGGESFTYRQVGEQIGAIHALFRDSGIAGGDHVALLGKNSARWGILYLATITYGAVIVPILPDFKPADVHFIVNHSDSKILFAEETLFATLNRDEMAGVRRVVMVGKEGMGDGKGGMRDGKDGMGDGKDGMRDGKDGKRNGKGGKRNGMDGMGDGKDGMERVAVISYTSGTTGFSKGVVLPHRSLLENILYAQRNMPLNPKDRILSFLPLAHTYGCAFEFLFPFTLGCDITFLTRTPSPKIIMQAFQEIRPALILSVPLVIEKIYKSQVLPALRKPAVRIMIRIPGLNQLVYKKIRDKLVAVFGGNFRELVIGGAPFNAQAERFFRRIGFPFTVGYGMTECGPLISYASWKTTVAGASGRPVDELEIRIDSPDPQRVSGEILVRGSHVMTGYYKNEEATRAVIGDDGWLHTGDLGVIDRHGNIHIRGRSKSMILGPSGKNIYPEEIEAMLNNRFMVAESLVIDRDGKLVALIFPDAEAMEKAGHTRDELDGIFRAYINDLNHHLPKYIRIGGFEITDTEFEKTPKRSIKRFLYR